MKKTKVKIKNKALFDDYETIIDNNWEFSKGSVGEYSIEVPQDNLTSYVYQNEKNRDADLRTLNILKNDKG